ncbi:MAG: winged helix-turn-helix transcriptional regulator [Gammaproteobacteria bacterium]|nr:winged helix-turn-helix transcriptional regulator [Gammaproteobacteria bacterium]
MDRTAYLIVPLLQGFEWFDESLQRSLQARGWPQLTQPESSVMVHVILGIDRPVQIARSMGLTRQAVHLTIRQVVAKGIFELRDDPADKRGKVVALTALGRAMRRDARKTVRYLSEQLAARIGKRHVDNLRAAFATDWGAPIVCPPGRSPRMQPSQRRMPRPVGAGAVAGRRRPLPRPKPGRSRRGSV